MFLVGVGLGVVALLLGGLVGARGPFIMVCVSELVVFVLGLFLVRKINMPGLMAGYLTGVALVFLLCAACWGIMAGLGGWHS